MAKFAIMLAFALLSEPGTGHADGVPRFENLRAFFKAPMRPRRSDYLVTSTAGYFTAGEGGSFDSGAMMAQSGIVFEFTGISGTKKGASPGGRMVMLNDEIWGTTMRGGVADAGTIYRFNPTTGSFATVYEFGSRAAKAVDYVGVRPEMGLTLDGSGNLWGYTSTKSETRFFRVNPNSGSVSLMRVANLTGGSFQAADVWGELAFDGVDSLWGSARVGGAEGGGGLFKIHQTTGVASYVLATKVGRHPIGSPLKTSDGKIAVIVSTGTNRPFAVLGADVVTRLVTSLVQFPQVALDATMEEGVVESSAGQFVGQMKMGNGTYAWFKLGATISLQIVQQNRTNQGAGFVLLKTQPQGRVYSVAPEGGRFENGVMCFLGSNSIFNPSSYHLPAHDRYGATPSGGLAQDPMGTFVAMNRYGGDVMRGTAYAYQPDGQQIVVQPVSLGREPVGEPVVYPTSNQGQVQSFLGATQFGSLVGGLELGTLNRLEVYYFASHMTPQLRVAHETSFANPHHNPITGPSSFISQPFAGVFANGVDSISCPGLSAVFTGVSGALPGNEVSGPPIAVGDYAWGVTARGGDLDSGTIYQVDLIGRSVRSVASFGRQGMDGAQPRGALWFQPDVDPHKPVITDGMLWGVTQFGGKANKGTIYSIRTDTLSPTTWFSFDDSSPSEVGSEPRAGLISDGRGYLWGTTSKGGEYGYGTVFRMSELLHQVERIFSFSGPQGTTPGSFPMAPLLLGVDGDLYGTVSGATVDPVTRQGKGGGGIYRIQLGRRMSLNDGSTPLRDGVPQQLSAAIKLGKMEKTYILTAPSEGNVTRFTAQLTGPAAKDYTIISSVPESLIANQRVMITVRFKPSAVGLREAKLTLGGDSPDIDVFELPLQGTGVKAKVNLTGGTSLDESEAPGRVAVTVELDREITAPVSVPFSIIHHGASSADYRLVTPSPVHFRPMQTAVSILLEPVDDHDVEPNPESIEIKLGQTSLPSVVELGAFGSSAIEINDNDLPLGFGGAGTMVFRLGQEMKLAPYVANLVPDEMVLAMWTHNGKPLLSPYGRVIYKPACTAADAGDYRCTLRAAGGRSLVSAVHRVWIVDDSPQTVTVSEGGDCTLQFPAAGKGMRFAWERPPGSVAGAASGLSTARLRLAGLTSAASGTYRCVIDDGDGFSITREFALRVVNQKPLLAGPLVFPSGQVGRSYAQQHHFVIPSDPDPSRAASSYTVVGLPPGMSCDASSGAILGTPERAGAFALLVKLSNDFGVSTVSANLIVAPLGMGLPGMYEGAVGVSIASTSLIGKIAFSISSAGKVTGKLELFGRGTGAFVASMEQPADHPQFTFTVPMSQDVFTGVVEFTDTGIVAQLDGTSEATAIRVWKSVWSESNPLPPGIEGAGRLFVRHVYDPASGYGYMTTLTASNGKLTMVGKLSDNTAVTCSTSLSQDLDLRLRAAPYDGKGLFILDTRIVAATDGSPWAQLALPSIPDARWLRPRAARWTAMFPQGISMLESSAEYFGSAYVPPAPGEVIPGVPNPPVGVFNAVLSLDSDTAVHLTTEGPCVIERADGSTTLVRSFFYNASNGTFSGTATLYTGTSWEHNVSFTGLMNTASAQGYGYYLTKTYDASIPWASAPFISAPVSLRLLLQD